MATMNVKDAAGAVVPIEKPLAPGRAAATASRPVVLSNEDSTALADILAKIIAAPATEAKQDTGNTALSAIAALLTTQASYLDGIETLIGTTNGKDFATQTTLAAVNTVLGLVADAVVAAGASGSISAKLRAISRDLVANIVLAAGTNLIGRTVADASAATGGIASTSRIVSAAASTNGTSAKASAGRVYAVQGFNAAASVRYLKLYNKASAPTVGTDTPVKTLALPPGCGFAFDWPHGYSFATGIAYALTTGSADADAGTLTAADVLGLNVDYS